MEDEVSSEFAIDKDKDAEVCAEAPALAREADSDTESSRERLCDSDATRERLSEDDCETEADNEEEDVNEAEADS